MMGKSHLIISTGLTFSLLGLTDQSITIPVAAVTIIGSLLPDIDEPNSLLVSKAIPKGLVKFFQTVLLAAAVGICYLGRSQEPWNMVIAALIGVAAFQNRRKLRTILMILIGVGMVAFGQSFAPWSYLIGGLLVLCALLPHRGLTHTVYGLLVWTGLLYFAANAYDPSIWVSGGISYLLHLLADSVTNTGIRPLPPLSFKLRFKLISTGTWSGHIVESVAIGLTLMVVWFVLI